MRSCEVCYGPTTSSSQLAWCRQAFEHMCDDCPCQADVMWRSADEDQKGRIFYEQFCKAFLEYARGASAAEVGGGEKKLFGLF